MANWHDVESFARLERAIKRRLYGDDKEPGVYRMLLAGDFESVSRTRGVIYAYEQVLELMHEIAEAMNNADRQLETAPQPTRVN